MLHCMHSTSLRTFVSLLDVHWHFLALTSFEYLSILKYPLKLSKQWYLKSSDFFQWTSRQQLIIYKMFAVLPCFTRFGMKFQTRKCSIHYSLFLFLPHLPFVSTSIMCCTWPIVMNNELLANILKQTVKADRSKNYLFILFGEYLQIINPFVWIRISSWQVC